jgi:L-seryl-tRNA(Ser) seleniumtransferase
MGKDQSGSLANLPPVNQILEHPDIQLLHERVSRTFILYVTQKVLSDIRSSIISNKTNQQAARYSLTDQVVARVKAAAVNIGRPGLRKVVNATGVILHTGLGRAPLSDLALTHLQGVVGGYCNLEFDLEQGMRGERNHHVEDLLCFLTGAEGACVVNNNAAAVFLALNTLSPGKEAIVSRGQLIVIGGSFRIPDVMEKSGAVMKEVGTTNKTHLSDYEKAFSDRTGLVCLVHPSNFRVRGFVAEPKTTDVVRLSHEQGVPVVQDLGGGVLFDLQEFGLPHEPVVQESLAEEIDVVTFSGDKVLGGPQCGIIVGKKYYVDKIRTNPLMRVLRCDKLIFAALEGTLKSFLTADKGLQSNKVMQMLLTSQEALHAKARRILDEVPSQIRERAKIAIQETKNQIGSGALPLEELQSVALSMRPDGMKVDNLARSFRSFDPPIVGRIHKEQLLFDLRTISPEDEPLVTQAICAVFAR